MPSVRIETIGACPGPCLLVSGRSYVEISRFGPGRAIARVRAFILLTAHGLFRAPRACIARFYSPRGPYSPVLQALAMQI